MTDTGTPIVRMTDIHKSFGHVQALRGVDLDLHAGRVLGLIGDNGAGKTTLVKIMAGVFPPSRGTVHYKGEQVRWKNPSQSRAAGLEIVYQDLGLVPIMNIARNFFLGKELRSRWGFLDFNRMANESLRAITEMGIFLDDAEELVENLSGGERKALAISRSLYFGVQVLMLDEPTAALSVKETHAVLDLMETLKQRGIATVFITHNIHHAYAVSDHFVALNAGVKVLDADKADVTPEMLTEAVIGEPLAQVTSQSLAASVGNGSPVNR